MKIEYILVFFIVFIQATWCDEAYVIKTLAENNEKPSIFPLSFSKIIGSIYLMIMIGFATSCGVGGAALSLPIVMWGFNQQQEQAVAISQVIMLFGSLSNGFFLSKQFDQITSEPVINQEFSLICLPMILIGTMAGVRLAKFLPIIIPISTLGILLCFVTQKNQKNFKKEWENENRRISNSLLLVKQPENENNKPPIPVQIIKKMLFIIAIYILLGTFSGSKQFHSIIGIEQCDWLFWIFQLLIIVICLAFGQHVYQSLLTEKFSNNNNNNNIDESQNEYKKNISFTFLASFIAGFIGGLVGIGGGFILVPAFLSLGSTVRQSTGTSSFTIIFTGFSATFQSLIGGLYFLESFLQFAILVAISCYFVVK